MASAGIQSFQVEEENRGMAGSGSSGQQVKLNKYAVTCLIGTVLGAACFVAAPDHLRRPAAAADDVLGFEASCLMSHLTARGKGLRLQDCQRMALGEYVGHFFVGLNPLKPPTSRRPLAAVPHHRAAGRGGAGGAFMQAQGDGPAGGVGERTSVPNRFMNSDGTCSVDDFEGCAQEELELLYVDVLWAYYDEKKQILSDEDYSRLVTELNWKGSGFPSLRRTEIAFVKAALAFAKGEPIVDDERWQVMKDDLKSSVGKRREVTEFLLYARAMRETAATRERLEKEMCDSGIQLAVTPLGISCTLADVPASLQANVRDVVEMYLALSLVPTGICLASWVVVAAIAGGQKALFDTAIYGVPAAGVVSFGLTRQLIRYVELIQPELLVGQCPCCEAEIKHLKSMYSGPTTKLECANCKTDLELDLVGRQIGKAQGLNMIGQKGESEQRWIDDILTSAWFIVGAPGKEDSRLGPPGKEERVQLAPNTTAWSYSIDRLNDGLFAWSILVGYGLFGEQFIQRVRGKGIQLHSQAINSFCQRYAIPSQMKQKYIQTAKRNGHDLGFLVPGNKLFGDGLFGEPALAWWKAQGW